MADEPSREEKLASMARRFVDRAREQAGRLESLRPLIVQQHGAGEALKDARQLIHSLHGSAGTFGFGEISVAAGVAEDLCDSLIQGGDTPVESQFRDLDSAIVKLLGEIGRIEHPLAK